MKRCFGSNEFPADIGGSVVALGNFDGVHLGHRKLIQAAVEEARGLTCESAVYTFDPHPVKILAPRHCPPLLQTLDQKLGSLEELGVDICIIEPFTLKFAHMDPDSFFKGVLIDTLRAKSVVAGYDFTFGVHRQGTVEALERLCQENGIRAHVVEAQFIGDILISSTNVRNMVLGGDVGAAAALLGRPYSIEGRVVSGRGLGGKMNSHTANIETPNEIRPSDGVYITTTAIWDEGGHSKTYPSVTSIGDNPTFPGSGFSIETHLLDTTRDVLGYRVGVSFLERMRDQISFASTTELCCQIARDIDKARAYHSKRGLHGHAWK